MPRRQHQPAAINHRNSLKKETSQRVTFGISDLLHFRHPCVGGSCGTGCTVYGPKDGEVVHGRTVYGPKDGEVVHGRTVYGPKDGITN
jgi:hypothetical protein